MDHSIRPVFKINIHLYIKSLRFFNNFFYIAHMFLRCFSQLFFKVSERPFAKQVNNFPTGIINPVKRQIPINKTKHLNFSLEVIMAGPLSYFTECLKFTCRDSGRCYFNTIDFYIFKKKFGDVKFFER